MLFPFVATAALNVLENFERFFGVYWTRRRRRGRR